MYHKTSVIVAQLVTLLLTLLLLPSFINIKLTTCSRYAAKNEPKRHVFPQVKHVTKKTPLLTPLLLPSFTRNLKPKKPNFTALRLKTQILMVSGIKFATCSKYTTQNELKRHVFPQVGHVAQKQPSTKTQNTMYLHHFKPNKPQTPSTTRFYILNTFSQKRTLPKR